MKRRQTTYREVRDVMLNYLLNGRDTLLHRARRDNCSTKSGLSNRLKTTSNLNLFSGQLEFMDTDVNFVEVSYYPTNNPHNMIEICLQVKPPRDSDLPTSLKYGSLTMSLMNELI